MIVIYTFHAIFNQSFSRKCNFVSKFCINHTNTWQENKAWIPSTYIIDIHSKMNKLQEKQVWVKQNLDFISTWPYNITTYHHHNTTLPHEIYTINPTNSTTISLTYFTSPLIHTGCNKLPKYLYQFTHLQSYMLTPFKHNFSL